MSRPGAPRLRAPGRLTRRCSTCREVQPAHHGEEPPVRFASHSQLAAKEQTGPGQTFSHFHQQQARPPRPRRLRRQCQHRGLFQQLRQQHRICRQPHRRLQQCLATQGNFWGCQAGPGQRGCDLVVVHVNFTPWLDAAAEPDAYDRARYAADTGERQSAICGPAGDRAAWGHDHGDRGRAACLAGLGRSGRGGRSSDLGRGLATDLFPGVRRQGLRCLSESEGLRFNILLDRLLYSGRHKLDTKGAGIKVE